jgi:hypothetical protein
MIAGWLLVLNMQTAYGQCLEDARTVTLSKGNVARLKSAICKADANDIRVKVEQYRLSDAAASIIISGQSQPLKGVIGKFQVAKNDVLTSYADLLSKFGETTVIKGDYYAWLAIPKGADDEASRELVELRGSKLRTLGAEGDNFAALDYPAIEEIRKLRTKVMPSNLAFFYEVACSDRSEWPKLHDDSNKCFKYKASETTMLFWRSMEGSDVAFYSDRAKQYNLQLSPKNRKNYVLDLAVPRELRLYEYISKGVWPKDFITLSGYRMEDGCDDASTSGVSGWRFVYHPRMIFMDATVIQNLSKKPISIDQFLGTSSADSTLRPLSPSRPEAIRLGIDATTVAPGESILVPTRVVFVPSEGEVDQFSYQQTAEQIYAARGNQGFAGDAHAHRAPDLKDFVYGPEIGISGIITAGTTINLQEAAKTALNVTISSDSGSCPYLLFRQPGDEWASSGKILQTAKGLARETAESIAFPGLVSQFRLEEREPEVARIRGATLTIRLKGGETLTLAPNQPFEGDGVQLLWGDALEFSFPVPQSIAGDDVKESRLEITGHYDRYSKILISDSSGRASTTSNQPSATCIARRDIQSIVRRVLK